MTTAVQTIGNKLEEEEISLRPNFGRGRRTNSLKSGTSPTSSAPPVLLKKEAQQPYTLSHHGYTKNKLEKEEDLKYTYTVKERPTNISDSVYSKSYLLSYRTLNSYLPPQDDVEKMKEIGVWTENGINFNSSSNGTNARKLNSVRPSKKIDALEEFNRKIQGLLNKLSIDNFDSISNQLTGIFKTITTPDLLISSINLICSKARLEPHFSHMYAELCRRLNRASLKFTGKSGQVLDFRQILLNSCQTVFQKPTPSVDEESEEFIRAKLESIGNIIFIGELCKLQMVPIKIIHERCINSLFKSVQANLTEKNLKSAEESILKLCKFVQVIGKMMSLSHPLKARGYVQQLRAVGSYPNLGSRYRFVIKDVIDLAENNWEPRHPVETPKIIDTYMRDELESAGLSVDHSHSNNNIDGPKMPKLQSIPVIPLEELKLSPEEERKIDMMLAEFWVSFDLDDAMEIAAESGHYSVIVEKAIVASLTKKDNHRKQVMQFLLQILRKESIPRDQLLKGFKGVFSQMEDLQMEIPFATKFVAEFIAVFVKSGRFSLGDFEVLFPVIGNDSLISQLIQKIGISLEQE